MQIRNVVSVVITALLLQSCPPVWSQQDVQPSSGNFRHFKKMLSRMRSVVKHRTGSTAQRKDSHKRNLSVDNASQILLPTAFVKCTPDTDLIINNERKLRFTSGEVLVAARYPVMVVNKGNRLVIGRHGIVSIQAREGIFLVRNLSEAKCDTVVVEYSGMHFQLPAGKELLWAANSSRLLHFAQCDNVQRRMPNIYDLPNGNQILETEFSTISAIKNSPMLFHMAHSPVRNDQIVFNKIMKMAACLAVVTRPHGPYLSVLKDTAVASASPNTPVSYRSSGSK
jgi:hypothetical protein